MDIPAPHRRNTPTSRWPIVSCLLPSFAGASLNQSCTGLPPWMPKLHSVLISSIPARRTEKQRTVCVAVRLASEWHIYTRIFISSREASRQGRRMWQGIETQRESRPGMPAPQPDSPSRKFGPREAKTCRRCWRRASVRQSPGRNADRLQVCDQKCAQPVGAGSSASLCYPPSCQPVPPSLAPSNPISTWPTRHPASDD